MKRTDFFKINTVDGTNEVDPLQNTLGSFKMKRNYQIHKIRQFEEKRPDLVSYLYYNTIEYWWIICVANDIQCPLSEFIAGINIKIPSILDIADFYRKAKVR